MGIVVRYTLFNASIGTRSRREYVCKDEADRDLLLKDMASLNAIEHKYAQYEDIEVIEDV